MIVETEGTTYPFCRPLGVWEREQLHRECGQGNRDQGKAGAMKGFWNESVGKQYSGLSFVTYRTFSH